MNNWARQLATSVKVNIDRIAEFELQKAVGYLSKFKRVL